MSEFLPPDDRQLFDELMSGFGVTIADAEASTVTLDGKKVWLNAGEGSRLQEDLVREYTTIRLDLQELGEPDSVDELMSAPAELISERLTTVVRSSIATASDGGLFAVEGCGLVDGFIKSNDQIVAAILDERHILSGELVGAMHRGYSYADPAKIKAFMQDEEGPFPRSRRDGAVVFLANAAMYQKATFGPITARFDAVAVPIDVRGLRFLRAYPLSA